MVNLVNNLKEAALQAVSENIGEKQRGDLLPKLAYEGHIVSKSLSACYVLSKINRTSSKHTIKTAFCQCLQLRVISVKPQLNYSFLLPLLHGLVDHLFITLQEVFRSADNARAG